MSRPYSLKHCITVLLHAVIACGRFRNLHLAEMSYLCCFSKRRTTGLEPEHQLWPINDIPDIAKKGNKTDIQPTDRDFLALQWRRSVTRRCSRLDASNRELLLELSEKDDLHSSIWYLDQEYKDRGLAIGIKHLEPTLQSINSFSDALTCLSQSGPKVTQILWGSFLLLIKVKAPLCYLSEQLFVQILTVYHYL